VDISESALSVKGEFGGHIPGSSGDISESALFVKGLLSVHLLR